MHCSFNMKTKFPFTFVEIQSMNMIWAVIPILLMNTNKKLLKTSCGFKLNIIQSKIYSSFIGFLARGLL